jgi:hypothetical protein
MLDEKKLDYPIFTVFYKKCMTNAQDCPDGGVITFGRHDRKNCGPILGWTPPIDQKEFLWKFPVDELSVGTYKYSQKVQAITDTAASHLKIGQTVYDKIIAEVKAVPVPGGSPGAQKVKCNDTVDLKIKINNIDYSLPLTAITTELGNNDCQLQIAGQPDADVWILGDPWVRSFCQIHDWQERKVGFAKPGENQPGAEYTPPSTTTTTTTRRPRPTRPTVTRRPPVRRTQGTPAPDTCKDTSRSCFNWNRNGFCTGTFYTEDKKQELCAKTCNKCPAATNTGNTQNAARRARPSRPRRTNQRSRNQPAHRAPSARAPRARAPTAHQNTHTRQNPQSRQNPRSRPAAHSPRNPKQAQVAARRAQNARRAQAQRIRNQVHRHELS